jgi:hypothetical protein
MDLTRLGEYDSPDAEMLLNESDEVFLRTCVDQHTPTVRARRK